jgi:hypothetical protein
LDFSLKCVKVMMGHLHALDILTRGADEVVVMVVRVKQFVPLHAIKDIDLREDVVVRQEVELSIYSRLIHRGMLLRNLLQELGGGHRLVRGNERLDHSLANLRDAEAFRPQGFDQLLRGGVLRCLIGQDL